MWIVLMRISLPPWFKFLAIFALTYLFLVSIGLMGHAFKGFGRGFAEQMIQTTAVPLVGLMIGVLATSLVQSSSLTTSLVVGMVAGGVLNVTNAIPIIMGANIGTAVTNTLVSLGHIRRKDEFRRAFAAGTVADIFNILAVAILFPLQLTTNFLGFLATGLSDTFAGIGGASFTSPVKLVVKPAVSLIGSAIGNHYVVELLVAVAILFLALRYLVVVLRSLVISRLEAFFGRYVFTSAIRGMLFGLALTVLVQSSSIALSLIVPLAGAGVLNLVQIYPYTLGANIGTTVTALLASLATGSIEAVTVAFAHLSFNLCGTIIFYPLRWIPIRLSEMLAELAVRRTAIVIAYLFVVFFLIPAVVIFAM
jgi:solute carrier family 34 (sodium-dependent phosphate cotransporter)